MSNYPEHVARIAEDYLSRVKAALGGLPDGEREDFVSELRSHLFEAFQREETSEDGVVRMLRVLRNLGEPSELVAERLPGALVDSGSRHRLPLRVAIGAFVALFGIPLGIGGVAVLFGVTAGFAGALLGLMAGATAVTVSGGLMVLLGMVRIYRPELWTRLVDGGVIVLDRHVADFMEALPAGDQGLLFIAAGAIVVTVGVAMIWVALRLARSLRALLGFAAGWISRIAQSLRQRRAARLRPVTVR